MLKRILITCLIFLICTHFVLSDIFINEIMYDPQGADNNKEFVEIIGTNNLTGYIIGDESSNDSLILLQYINTTNYSIIVEEDFNFSSINCSVYSAGATIGNGLNNGGDIVSLFLNGSLIDSISYYNLNVIEGYSLELVNNSWLQSLGIGGTPGRQNTAKRINNSTAAGDLDIDIGISSINLTLGEILHITGNISTTFAMPVQANLTIKIARKIKGNWNYKWYLIQEYSFVIDNDINLTKIFNKTLNWTIPDDLIRGDYKVLATMTYSNGTKNNNRYASEEFFVQGLQDLGEHNLTIIDTPDNMRFGDIDNVLVRFDSNNYNFNNISFAAYIYSPRWASIDLDDNTLRTRPFESNVAVIFNNLTRGTTLYLSIPLLTKRNCENDFESGDYITKVRAYENDDDIIEENFGIKLSGVNDAMCPKTKTVYKSSGGSSSNAIKASDINQLDSFTYDDVKFEIAIPSSINRDFDVNITLTNSKTQDKKIDVWSYVYSGSKSLMERTANKQEILLSPNITRTLVLNNKITEKDIPIKEYRVMVKANSSNRKSVKTFSSPVDIIMDYEGNDKDKPMIKSFYTRAENYNNKINLFAGCEGDNLTLVLESFYGSITKRCEKTTFFEVDIINGTNLFFLSLTDNKTIFDTKKLLIVTNRSFISSYSESFKIFDIMNTYSKKNDKKGLELISGNVINEPVILYESSNIKLKKLTRYLLIGLFTLIIILYFWKKEF